MNKDLRDMLDEHPTAKIVTDVGASLFSGWGELAHITYHEDCDTLELEFK